MPATPLPLPDPTSLVVTVVVTCLAARDIQAKNADKKSQSKQQAKTLLDERNDSKNRKIQQHKADIQWKTSMANKNDKMAALATGEEISKVSDVTGVIVGDICDIWPNDQKIGNWDVFEFGDIVLDIKSSQDPLFGPLCALRKAMERKSNWSGIKLILMKVHELYKANQKKEAD